MQHEDHVRRVFWRHFVSMAYIGKAEKCELSVKIGLHPHP
jgi:hypothetical protein